MNRPYVDLDSENTIQILLNSLNKTLNRFIQLDGIVGITLNGGLSRGYGDYLSEIDVVIYLHDEQYVEYKNGRYPFALGITMIDGNLYDIKTMSYEKELESDYDSVALWDLSYAKILYDPDKHVTNLIEFKLSHAVHLSQAEDFLWNAYWNYKLAGDIWIHRQDSAQGHFTLNNAINPLISALFVVNEEYVPHEKWLVHMSQTLAWRPDNWESRLRGAMNTGDFSIRSLANRQNFIDELWKDINNKLCRLSGFHNALDFTQKSNYEELVKLLKVSEYSIPEWEAISSLGSLNYEPLHSIFKRIGDRIVLDKDTLLSLDPKDMYVWMYQIADEARKEVYTV